MRPLDPAALVFDAYGTLFDVGSITAACGEVTPHPPAFAALWRQKQLEYTWLRNSMRRHADFEAVTADALDHVAVRLGVELPAEARARLLAAWWTVPPFDEVTAALERLARRRRLAILSNGTPRMLATALAASGLGDRFAAVLSVESVAAYKPDPRAYALAADTLALDPSRLLFVSANGWDVAGATAAGLASVYLSRAAAPPERLGAMPVAVVPDLAALADFLEASGTTAA